MVTERLSYSNKTVELRASAMVLANSPCSRLGSVKETQMGFF